MGVEGQGAVPLVGVNGREPAGQIQVPMPQMAQALYRHGDGTFWLQHIVTLGPVQLTYALPMDVIDEYVTQYRNNVGRIKEEWRKARTGLVLPPTDGVIGG